MAKITCFGEVLWDVFKKHKKIGGAPLNVAVRLQSFNNQVSLISKIGKDPEGQKIIDYLKFKGVNTSNIQVDDVLPTGEVKVALDSKGSATYNIKYPRSWDSISLNKNIISNVKEADVFVFGSLISRDERSRATLFELFKVANYKVFDVNLRVPFCSIDILKDLMQQADFIKFNDEELFYVAKKLGFTHLSLEKNIKFIAKITKTKSICVTKGGHGATLFYNNVFYYNGGYKVEVVDTVGAGDSFLASLISKLINEDDAQNAIDFACAVGAIVAGREGAVPDIHTKDIKNIMRQT